MDGEWNVGDAALCMDDSPCPVFGPTSLVAGRTYTVIAVRTDHCSQTGFRGTGLKLAGNHDDPPWHNKVRFQKAPSHEADEYDQEIIHLMTTTPHTEEA